jgi:4-amino-4-deoxy-L-arabinose transferase-like glycosyltransferase
MTLSRLPRSSTKWIALVLLIFVYGAAQWIGRRDVALTDDGFEYLGAAQAYKAWYISAWHTVTTGHGDAFRQAVIDRHFQMNYVHPPVAKALMGAGIALFHDRLGWLDEIDAARTAVMFLSTMTAALMFLLCWPVYGPVVSVSAPLFLLVMPRFFFDSHVESLDVASAATYFAAVFCFWHGRRSVRWAILAAVAAGVAMGTKINGALVVLPLAIAWLAGVMRQPGGWAERRRYLQSPPLALMLMLEAGPVVAILLWPWLWADTIGRLIRYMAFYLHHHSTLFYYFGTIYDVPFAPWHAAFVMTAITTPIPILSLGAIGVGITASRSRAASQATSDVRDLDALIVLNAVCTIGAVALPNVPKYGGVKLFLPFFPFLAILAGIGLNGLATILADRAGIPERRRAVVVAIAIAALIAPMGWTLARIHPYELSYYNALVGGLSGAERRGFEIQYYDLWYLDLATWLNTTYPDGVRVYFEPNNKEYVRHARWYYATGRLRDTVTIVSDASRADILVLTHEMRWPQYPAIRDRLRTSRVLHQIAVEGVPLLTVYEIRGT